MYFLKLLSSLGDLIVPSLPGNCSLRDLEERSSSDQSQEGTGLAVITDQSSVEQWLVITAHYPLITPSVIPSHSDQSKCWAKMSVGSEDSWTSCCPSLLEKINSASELYISGWAILVGVQCTLTLYQYTLCNMYCMLYTTLYTVHFTLYTVYLHCSLYTVHCTVYSVYCTLFTENCTLYTVQ